MARPPGEPTIPSFGSKWHELYTEGAFGQRELISGSTLLNHARDHGIFIGLGREPLERLDRAGAFTPIAFARQGYFSGHAAPAMPMDSMSFREEVDYVSWDSYAWDAYGHPQVSELYSPWQLLYLRDAVDEGKSSVALDLLLGNPERLRESLEAWREWGESQWFYWRALDARWQPLIKLLVALQGRYWPEVSGRRHLLWDPESGQQVDPFQVTVERFVPEALVERAGIGAEDLVTAYGFLCRRAMALEPADNLSLLRRAVPRPFHIRWRGDARLADEYVDAANLIRLFHADLTGNLLPDADVVVDDTAAASRSKLLGHGPRLYLDAEDVKRALVAAELYPHGLHVVHEGASERRLVEVLISELMWPELLEAVRFTDLHGSGAAPTLRELVEALSGYAMRAVVIADSEGEMADYVRALIRAGTLSAEDVMLFEASLEESNFSPDELIELVRHMARTPTPGRYTTEIRLTAAELRDYHAERLKRSGKDRPGLADSLRVLARRPDHGAFEFSKLELAEAMARRMLAEVNAARGSSFDPVFDRRPALALCIGAL